VRKNRFILRRSVEGPIGEEFDEEGGSTKKLETSELLTGVVKGGIGNGNAKEDDDSFRLPKRKTTKNGHAWKRCYGLNNKQQPRNERSMRKDREDTCGSI